MLAATPIIVNIPVDLWSRWALLLTALGAIATPGIAWWQLAMLNKNERRKTALEYVERSNDNPIPVGDGASKYTVIQAVRKIARVAKRLPKLKEARHIAETTPDKRAPDQQSLVEEYVDVLGCEQLVRDFFTRTEGLIRFKSIDGTTFMTYLGSMCLIAYRSYMKLQDVTPIGNTTVAFEQLRNRVLRFHREPSKWSERIGRRYLRWSYRLRKNRLKRRLRWQGRRRVRS